MECVSQVVVREQLVQVVDGAKEVELDIRDSVVKWEAKGLVQVMVGRWEVPESDEIGMDSDPQ